METEPAASTSKSSDSNLIENNDPKNNFSVRIQRNQAEKKRRDRLNEQIAQLATLVPTAVTATKPLDKVSILRLAASWMRLNYSCLHPKRFKSVIKNYIDLHRSLISNLDILEKSINGFIVATTFSGIILMCSKYSEEYIGYQNIDLLGHDISSFIHSKEKDLFHKKIRNAISKYKKNSPRIRSIVRLHMQQRPLARSNDVKYRKMSFSLTIHAGDSVAKEQVNTKTIKFGQRKDYGENAVILIFIEPIQVEPNIDVQYLEQKDCYLTVHGTQGEIIFADHRISIMTGYMPSDVLGNSAYQYIHPSDIPIALFAQKAMFASNDGTGIITYRLRIQDTSYIYLQSKGQIRFQDSSKEVRQFICFNLLLNDQDGQEELRKFQDRFAPQLIASKIAPQNSITTSNTAVSECSDEKAAKIIRRSNRDDFEKEVKLRTLRKSQSQDNSLLKEKSVTSKTGNPNSLLSLKKKFDSTNKSFESHSSKRFHALNSELEMINSEKPLPAQASRKSSETQSSHNSYKSSAVENNWDILLPSCDQNLSSSLPIKDTFSNDTCSGGVDNSLAAFCYQSLKLLLTDETQTSSFEKENTFLTQEQSNPLIMTPQITKTNEILQKNIENNISLNDSMLCPNIPSTQQNTFQSHPSTCFIPSHKEDEPIRYDFNNFIDSKFVSNIPETNSIRKKNVIYKSLQANESCDKISTDTFNNRSHLFDSEVFGSDIQNGLDENFLYQSFRDVCLLSDLSDNCSNLSSSHEINGSFPSTTNSQHFHLLNTSKYQNGVSPHSITENELDSCNSFENYSIANILKYNDTGVYPDAIELPISIANIPVTVDGKDQFAVDYCNLENSTLMQGLNANMNGIVSNSPRQKKCNKYPQLNQPHITPMFSDYQRKNPNIRNLYNEQLDISLLSSPLNNHSQKNVSVDIIPSSHAYDVDSVNSDMESSHYQKTFNRHFNLAEFPLKERWNPTPG